MVNKKTSSYVHVLIVEDDKGTARIAKAICESLGCVASIANNGIEALQLYDECRLDIILLDLQMPGMGGFETAFELRQMEKDLGSTPLPIIAVTGENAGRNHMRSVSGGMNGCVDKPYTTQMVRKLLEQYVAGYRAPDALAGMASVSRAL